MMPYERFEAWQRCHELALLVYRVTRSFPAEERFGLTSQLRRSAFSAAVNIAEGSAKHGRREFRRFLDISLGSLSEVSYTILFCREVGLLERERGIELEALRERASQVTWSLYKSLDPRHHHQP
jgi:four helix bundle protein